MTAPTIQPGVYSSTAHNALAQWVDDTRTGLIAWGQRTTNSSGTGATEIEVLRLDDVPTRAGIAYQVVVTASLDSTVANDAIKVQVRYTTDGSTPTTSSSLLPGSSIQTVQTNASAGETRSSNTIYVPSGDETLSLLLTLQRTVGTGTVIVNADGAGFATSLYVNSLGVSPGDTGVDL